MNLFSAKYRQDSIRQISNTQFDLLVIGGGITGAGIALDATTRGLKVALIDMQDFAGGTSGRSTKLIHGGLRYLKQLEFNLVAEVGKEREIIHKNAPHLTRPEKMLLPIVKGGSMSKFAVRLGMWLYEWLAGVKREESAEFLNKQDTLRAEPLLRKTGLLGGVLFYEYRTDDARLTLEIIKEAVSRGAMAVNYTRAFEFIYENERIQGAKVGDQQSGESFVIRATHVVNAAGPWVDELDDLDKTSGAHKLHITKGVHIVLDRKRLPVKQSVYFDTFDRRMIFVIPRDKKTYIGTTDTFYEGDLLNPRVTAEDKNYLLKCVNDYFPENNLSTGDIESCWAGLRPLINKPGKGPSEISRKDEIFTSGSGLIIIAGGKLTGYRKMAQRTVDLVAEKIWQEGKKNIGVCTTDRIRVSGGKMQRELGVFIMDKAKEGLALGLDETEARDLVYRYGSNIDELYAMIILLKDEPQVPGDVLPAFIKAQVRYAVEKEMCLTPSDFFIRRTGMLHYDRETVEKWRRPVTLYMQELLLWDNELKERYDTELREALNEVKL